MTGLQFERAFCEWLKQRDFWVLNIPRSHTGAQPFDVLAMRDRSVIAADCNVISDGPATFPFDRIEDNQRLAFDMIQRKASVMCCIAVWYEPAKAIYIVPYVDIVAHEASGRKSIHLTSPYKTQSVIDWWCK